MVVDATVVQLTYKDAEHVRKTVDDDRKLPALIRLEREVRDAAKVEPHLEPSLSLYQRLVSSGWDVNTVGEDQQNGLTSAVLAESLNSVNFLLGHGSRVTQQALIDSSYSDSAEIAEALFNATHLDARSALSGQLLRNAAAHNVNVTRLLLRRGDDANSREPDHGTTPLEAAISSGSFANVSLLLDHGADVNLRGYRGLAPLGVAATQLNSGFIPLL